MIRTDTFKTYYLQATLTAPKYMALKDSDQHHVKPTAQTTEVIINGKNSNLPLGINSIGCMTSINSSRQANMTNDM